MVNEPILERLPPLVQNERNRDQLDVQYDADTDVYLLPKAPVLTVHTVTGYNGGEEVEFTEGVDYTLSNDPNGLPEKIDWSIGGDAPDDGTAFTVDESFQTIIERYSVAHDEEFGFFGDEVDATIKSHEIDQATGEDLDRLGAIFGTLGKRRGRSDQDYRIYLKSVVQSFNGRGSLSGLKFAIASAIGADTNDIEIVERFDALEYDVQIFNVGTAFISSAINDLAELADPSVVQLGEAVIVVDSGGVLIGGEPAVNTVTTTGLGGGTLTMDGNSTLG